MSMPPAKERWIVLELQQRGSNLLGFRHAFVRGIKARFLGRAFGICHVPHPRDISIAHMESSYADIYVITVPHLRGAGEGNDAAQIRFRAVFWGGRLYTIRTTLKAVIRNYGHPSQV